MKEEEEKNNNKRAGADTHMAESRMWLWQLGERKPKKKTLFLSSRQHMLVGRI
jgi:hypothetical protein